MDESSCECKAGAPGWMVTFADLMSLLLTFFVLLLSFSNMEIVKFQTMMGSVKNALGLKSELELSDVPTGAELLPHQSPREGDGKMAAEEMEKELKEMLEKVGGKESGEVKVTKRGVVLQLSGDLLFASGEAELSSKAKPILDGLAQFVTKSGRSVDVAGHTDNVPIATSVFPSNWELSAARAGQAVRYLSEHGVPPERLRAIGHADTVAIKPNETPEGRESNRRVEFVFTTVEEPDNASSDELSPDLERYAEGDTQ